MPTLSIFKQEFFRVAKWAGIILTGLLIIFILIRGAIAIKEKIAPSPPPPPTVGFGKIPPINFPDNVKKEFKYSIDTISGELPEFPDKTKVYKIEESGPDILAIGKIQEKVKSLGFTGDPQKLSDSLYRWTTQPPLVKSLTVNTKFPEFFLISNFINDPNIAAGFNLPTEEEAAGLAKNFVTSLSFYPEDIDEGKTKTVLYSMQNGVINPATSVSNAKLIGVYFYQKDRDGLPITYSDGLSSMNLTISGGDLNSEIVDARFFYKKISEDNETYPIITAQEAFERLKKGKGNIISYDPKAEEVKIKRVYLAMYLGKLKQDYLMPVVVFEGDNNFLAYVSAVKDEWIGN